MDIGRHRQSRHCSFPFAHRSGKTQRNRAKLRVRSPRAREALHKYVGKEVTLVRSYQENGTTKREEIKATLLSDNNGPVWKIGNDIVTGMYAESYRFPKSSQFFERPTLLMSLENSGPKAAD